MYIAKFQSNDNVINLNDELTMQECYDKLEEILETELDGDISNDFYSVAETPDDYITISMIK